MDGNQRLKQVQNRFDHSVLPRLASNGTLPTNGSLPLPFPGAADREH